MKIPKIDFSIVSRILIVIAITLIIFNEFNYHSTIVNWIAITFAVLSVISMILFAIQIKKGIFKPPIQIVLETNVEKALDDGVITEEQAKKIPKRVVLDSNKIFLNIVFNFAIINHFDLVPIEVLHDSLPNVPPYELQRLYNKARDISDDLNDYFRSQKFANKADVITRTDEIKKYLAKTYPWMASETLENTYNYFFLGIGNG